AGDHRHPLSFPTRRSSDLEEDMSFPCGKLSSPIVAALALMSLAVFFPTSLRAQDDQSSKYDLFVGYQWLHPGGDAPIPGTQANRSEEHTSELQSLAYLVCR